MNHDESIPTLEGCEAVQFQLSELADSGQALPAELRAHIDACAECAEFARQWLTGAPGVLTQPIPGSPDARLRERILDAGARTPEVIPFPVPVSSPGARGGAWKTWAGRIAACAAMAAFSWSLLNPAVSTLKSRTAAAASPTLSQSLSRIEDKSKHEQRVLQTALVDGGRRVRDSMSWSMSALEL